MLPEDIGPRRRGGRRREKSVREIGKYRIGCYSVAIVDNSAAVSEVVKNNQGDGAGGPEGA